MTTRSDRIREIAERIEAGGYLCQRDVVEWYGVSRATVWRWTRDGLIIAERIGGITRYPGRQFASDHGVKR